MSEVREQLEVSSGYAGFALRGEEDIEPLAGELIDSTLVEVVEVNGEYEVWVKAGSQWGPYDVVIERHPSPPPPAAAEWEDVVELSLRSGSRLAVMDIDDTDPLARVTRGAGEIRLRVCARGRAEGQLRDLSSDEDEGLSPVEHFLLQSWEAPMAEHVVVRLSAPLLTEDELDPPVPGKEAGLAATRAIGRDLDGAPGCRVLSGRTGTVTVTGTITGTRRRLFRAVDAVTGWPGGYMGWGDSDLVVGAAYTWKGLDRVEEDGDRFTGEGHLTQTVLEFRSPAYLVQSWVWMNNGPDPDALLEGATPFLPGPTSVRIDLTEHTADDGGRQTRVDVRHDGLPEEWLDDMSAYWHWMLAIGEARGFGVR